MKIKKFNETFSKKEKFYVYSVPDGSQTYRGSIWDNPTKPWIPDGAKLISEFETNREYIIVTQDELNEINNIKDELKMKDNVKKYNL